MSDNVTFSANQKRALSALLSEKTVRDAAKKCKLTEKTLYQYLRDEQFRQALQTEQAAIYTAATTRLTAGIDRALDELERLITDAKSEAVRRAAISEWLTQALRLKEQIELEARIQALEERMK